MRLDLRTRLEQLTSLNWSHVTTQIGMFCYSGLNKEQVGSVMIKYSCLFVSLFIYRGYVMLYYALLLLLFSVLVLRLLVCATNSVFTALKTAESP